MGGSLAYIGEGDDVSKRLYQHSRAEEQGGKDFWDRAIVLTSKDANLTKAHARYLESRLITLAQQANRARLMNGTAPAPLPLPESDVSDMEYFIAQAKIALPVLGVNLFRNTTVSITPSNPSEPSSSHPVVSPLFEMSLKRYGIVATAQEVDGEFTVLEGSLARASWIGVEEDGYRRLREKLVKDGTLIPSADGTLAVFSRNQVFASPSAASAIVSGRNSNGRMEWNAQSTGLTYGAWQNQEIDLDHDEP